MHSELAAAFQHLDRVLTEYQDLWRPQPFTCDDLPWSHTHAHLRDALLALGDEEARQLHDDPQRRLYWLRHFEPDLCDALTAFEPSPVDVIAPPQLDAFDSVHIPGRKLQQRHYENWARKDHPQHACFVGQARYLQNTAVGKTAVHHGKDAAEKKAGNQWHPSVRK